jgi:hypothetical protein
MELLTQEQRATLLDNGRRQAPVRGTEQEIDLWPVVKLFYPAGAHTWLLTELDTEDPDVAWGLCRARHKPHYVDSRIMWSSFQTARLNPAHR